MTATPLSCFERIYVINLKSRADRRVEMAEQLERVGLGLASPQVQLFEAVRPDSPGAFPSIGTRGCFMSHLQVLRDARDRGLASVLILEDDLNFVKDFGTRFEPVRRCLQQQPWGMFYGSYTFYGEAPTLPDAPCVQADAQLPISTTAFVAVHGAWIGRLIKYLEAMLQRPAGDPAGGPMHVDGAYCWFRAAYPEMACWLAHPSLGYQRSSQTDIHPPRWFDRVQPVAAVVSILRKLRNRLRRL